MVSLKTLLFLATTATALVLEPRTVASTLSDLKTVDTNTKDLNSKIVNWDGTQDNSGPIIISEGTLDNSIKTATTNAKKEPVASSADSKTIISYVTGTLEPDVKTTLGSLKKRKADFVKAGLQTRVQKDLQTLKTDSDALADALIAAASSDQKTNAQNAKATLDADFNDAIAYFK